MTNIAATQTSSSQEWRTPKWLFDLLNLEFNFDIDAAATNENTLCNNWFTKENDGLKQVWWGNVFVNCPYNQAKLWVKKGYEEASSGNATVVLLIAARTDTRYWWDYVRWGDVRFLKGRIRFEELVTERVGDQLISTVRQAGSAPFPSAVVVFEKAEWYKHRPTTFYWDIPKEKRTEQNDVGQP